MNIDELQNRIINSKIYKDALSIMKKKGIKLTEEDFELLSQNRSNIKPMITAETGKNVEEGFQEFLLRMYKEDPKQFDRFMPLGEPATFNFFVRHWGKQRRRRNQTSFPW